MLEQTSKLPLLVSFAHSWIRESGYMKIKLYQGLWLVSPGECLMQTENRVPAVSPPEYIAGGFEDLPEA